ncbi:hypothetical protein ACFQ9V_08790 [Leifsonia sp. NPDC056665]|uniref:hypothetical protein n=1 Tax=Leifsonia sp. NPDC056665 TaxID=3345901 RepID=UPI0036AB6BC1
MIGVDEGGGPTVDSYTQIIELAHAFDSDPGPVIMAALERGVSFDEVVAAYMRTLRYLRIHGFEGTSKAPVTDVDARPPGTFDPHIVLQGELWIDILRRPFLVEEMPKRYAANVIVHLHNRVDSIVEVIDGGGDPHDWLDQTPLVRALRERASSAGDGDAEGQGPSPY